MHYSSSMLALHYSSSMLALPMPAMVSPASLHYSCLVGSWCCYRHVQCVQIIANYIYLCMYTYVHVLLDTCERNYVVHICLYVHTELVAMYGCLYGSGCALYLRTLPISTCMKRLKSNTMKHTASIVIVVVVIVVVQLNIDQLH